MSDLGNLKAATTLSDVADLLGYETKKLAYILYKKPKITKYNHFVIPKSTGGTRSISAPAPDLKTLQRRLYKLLDSCIQEINKTRKIQSTISHGYRQKYSIITNAAVHRNKRYVFNTDLDNFFGTINFGRVRGFFISNRNFELNPNVATVLAQIACHDNALPQGSPSSPIISNLIGHIIDIRLAALAKKTGCSYSRYVDDLTFSTNKRNFPSEIAKFDVDSAHQWEIGKKLKKTIKRTGFSINITKTRMQYISSRQDVTGLIVNSKVNTRAEYRRNARAMVHRLLNTGEFLLKEIRYDDDGNKIEEMVSGSLKQLNGILSFIDSVSVYDRKKGLKPSERKKPLTQPEVFSCNEKVYRSFLIYKFFHAPTKPLIICEGKTDNIYLKAAIESLADRHPILAKKDKDGKILQEIDFFRRTATTGRILGLGGGSGELINLIKLYLAENKHIRTAGKKFPVILLIDNDDGAKGLYKYAKNLRKLPVDPSAPFIHVILNLYIIPTPFTEDGKNTMIEDFFSKELKETKLDKKSFNPKDNPIDAKTEYGKNHFAKYVVKKNKKTIDFSKFDPILKRIETVLDDYSKKVS